MYGYPLLLPLAFLIYEFDFSQQFNNIDSEVHLQVLVRNVPPDPDEPVSEHIEHFFCVNHPDHYLTHQVCNFTKLC
jgi:hypothetical protein